jgi:hypothetical protein
VRRTIAKIDGATESKKVVFNDICAQDIIKMSKVHMLYQTFKLTYDEILRDKFKDQNVKKVLVILAKIFALKELEIDSHACYETGFLQSGSNSLIEEALDVSLKELRPYMVDLVEMRPDHTDNSYLSSIGNEYGDCYERQLEFAMGSRLNKNGVPDYFETYMKPMFSGKL